MSDLKEKLKAEMTNMSSDLIEANQRNFEKYSASFEKQHKKWIAEQTRLQKDIESDLEKHKYFTKHGLKGSLIMLLVIPVLIIAAVIHTLYTNAFQFFLLWTAQHDDISIGAGVVALILTAVLIFISGAWVNDKYNNRY